MSLYLDILFDTIDLYIDLLQKGYPKILTDNIWQVIINLKRWVTIDGRHVNIGGDGSGAGGMVSVPERELFGDILPRLRYA